MSAENPGIVGVDDPVHPKSLWFCNGQTGSSAPTKRLEEAIEK